ncbi:GNAT family N-acetyltransferase [Bradyrhizobium cenepequi]|uniref:GNAT family N-acetyltransferase n=1 Tax=Bradyrhizobium cenepequi TaxID=2821403 RepID=UPI001CE30297|nr:GNAT family N-acetyltransferase [Bradyrhizobium cenepequi]MCA6109823.1 GNAT family N-acetyltransferase [Bradyrhizobium cenepequi]
MITVTIDSPRLDIAPQWDELVRRASSNAFMNPAALATAVATDFAKLRVLLAWELGASQRRLVGIWALQVRQVVPLWPKVSEALPYNYAFLSSPVVDPAFSDQVLPAFLAAIEQDPLLSDVLSLTSFDAECPSYAAMSKWLAARGIEPLIVATSSRPFVTKEFGVKRSGSTRKKLRQDWNRLSALGVVDVVNDRSPGAVRQAFETFLAMEKASWKGERGTAVLSDARDADFTRQLVQNLADREACSVALLQVNGDVAAAQVLMYCGSTAYTWKTAYNAQFARYSPGHLLVDKVTDQLFAQPEIEAINSCAAEDSFMAQLWAGRRTMLDLLFDVRGTKSLGYRMEAGRLLGYHLLRRLRHRFRQHRPASAASKAPQRGSTKPEKEASAALRSPAKAEVGH